DAQGAAGVPLRLLVSMVDLAHLLQGFTVALSWYNLGLMLIGILLGIVVGVLPGLGGPNAVAILLPMTFSIHPTSPIILLSSIYWGALFGGAIASILFTIPPHTSILTPTSAAPHLPPH